jgi:hypothetical protein
MDHVKQLELELLLKFEEVGGVIAHRDFEKVFPANTLMWRAVNEDLSRSDYTTYGQYFLDDSKIASGAYGITEKGRVRIIQLQKEKSLEAEDIVKENNLGKDSKIVTNWTRIIGWGTLLLIALTAFLIWLEYNPPHKNVEIDEKGYIRIQQEMDSLKNLQYDSIKKADTPVLKVKTPVDFDPIEKKKTSSFHRSNQKLTDVQLDSQSRSVLIMVVKLRDSLNRGKKKKVIFHAD